MSNNVVDEFVVKVKLDSDEYEQGVGKLEDANDKLEERFSRTEEASKKVSESAGQLGESLSKTGEQTNELTERTDKLNEGLEDTDKQMQKTGKATRENARDIKNTTDEFQKLSTNIGTALSLMSKFTASMVAGTGFAKLATDVSKAAVELDNLGKKSNTTYKTMKSWEYAGSELGGDGQAMTQAIFKISQGVEAFLTSGDPTMHRFFNLMRVPYLDAETEKMRPITDILIDLTKEFAKHENKANLYYDLEQHGLAELFEPLVLNSPEEVIKVLNRQQKKFIASESDLANMREFTNNMEEIKNHFNSLNTLFVSSMLPTLIKVQEAIKGVLEYFQDNPEQAEIAGMLGMGAGLGLTGLTINKLFEKVFGKGGKGGVAGGILSDHVQKVFVVNMGQGGMGDKYPRNPKTGKPDFGAKRGLQAFASAENMSWAAQSIQDEKEYEQNPEAKKNLIDTFGEENYRRWAKEQGYSIFSRNPESKSVSELQKIAILGELSDTFGKDQVFDLINEHTSWWENAGLGMTPLPLERVVDILEEHGDKLKAPVKSQDEPYPLPVIGGDPREYRYLDKDGNEIGTDSEIKREVKDANQLSREGNTWLKQIYNNPTLQNINKILERVFPKDKNVAELAWGGAIAQPSSSSAFGFSGSYAIRDDDWDGSGVSPHTGMDGDSLMQMLSSQNNDLSSLRSRQEYAIEYFMRNGWTKEQAVGLVANFTAESGMLPHALNPNEKTKDGQTFKSHGIAQWNRERPERFKEVFNKDIRDSTLDEQLAFVQWELENTHHTAREALKRARTADEATEAITRHYEVPANIPQRTKERQEIARDLIGTTFSPYDMVMHNLRLPQEQMMASTSTVDVNIGNIVVNTTASTLTGVGEDMAEAVKARMMLGQLTTGAV